MKFSELPGDIIGIINPYLSVFEGMNTSRAISTLFNDLWQDNNKQAIADIAFLKRMIRMVQINKNKLIHSRYINHLGDIHRNNTRNMNVLYLLHLKRFVHKISEYRKIRSFSINTNCLQILGILIYENARLFNYIFDQFVNSSRYHAMDIDTFTAFHSIHVQFKSIGTHPNLHSLTTEVMFAKHRFIVDYTLALKDLTLTDNCGVKIHGYEDGNSFHLGSIQRSKLRARFLIHWLRNLPSDSPDMINKRFVVTLNLIMQHLRNYGIDDMLEMIKDELKRKHYFSRYKAHPYLIWLLVAVEPSTTHNIRLGHFL